ncbi:hypothetical protein MRX96_024923 [Rhipicephalus microplus]
MTSTSRCFVHCLRPVVRAKALESTATSSSGGGGRCRRSLRAGMPPELSAPKCYFRKRITRYPAARRSLEPGQLSGTPGPVVGRGGAAKKIPFLLSWDRSDGWTWKKLGGGESFVFAADFEAPKELPVYRPGVPVKLRCDA